MTSPVRPNSTTSASAITKGGVMIGSTDISLVTAPQAAAAAALHDQREDQADSGRQHADDASPAAAN